MDIIEKYKEKLFSDNAIGGIVLSDGGIVCISIHDTPLNMFDMMSSNIYNIDSSGFTYSKDSDSINFKLLTDAPVNNKFTLSKVKTEQKYFPPDIDETSYIISFSVSSNEVNLIAAILNAVGRYDQSLKRRRLRNCVSVNMIDNGSEITFSIDAKSIRRLLE